MNSHIQQLQIFSCPICHNPMTKISKSEYDDHQCKQKEHAFFRRIYQNQTSKIRIRFTESNGLKYSIKINYDQGFSEISSAKLGNSHSPLINIPSILDIDFSDIPKIKNKIKNYLLIS